MAKDAIKVDWDNLVQLVARLSIIVFLACVVIEGYKSITAAQIIAQLAQIVDELGLPHPMHLHQNNLGVPGNVTSTIETMRVLQGHRAHLAHLQFHAYGGHDWGSHGSRRCR